LIQPTIQPRIRDGLRLPWSWCMRCERAYVSGTCRIVRFDADALHPHPATLHLCPYGDCRASTNRDGWLWATIREQHSDYPVVPEWNVVYAR